MEEQSTCGSSTRKRPGEIPGNGTNLDLGEEPMDTGDVKNNQKKMKRLDSDEGSLKSLVTFF